MGAKLACLENGQAEDVEGGDRKEEVDVGHSEACCAEEGIADEGGASVTDVGKGAADNECEASFRVKAVRAENEK